MNNDLSILPILPEENERKPKVPIHPNLPDIYKGQLIAVVGGVRMGKGTLWNGFLHNPNFYADLWSSVTVISPTVWNDSTSRFTAKKYKETCYDIYDDSIIEGLIKKQIDKKKIADIDTSYCLVVDDCYGEFNRKGTKGGAVLRLASRFRHYVNKGDACMYLYSTQKYNDLVPLIRCNCTGLIVSGMIKNKKELETLRYDLDDTYGGRFDELMEKARTKPYDWVYFRLDSTPPTAFLNFTEQIF